MPRISARLWLVAAAVLLLAGPVLALGTPQTDAAQGPGFMPAHPDLIQRLGPQEVARLHLAKTPRSMAEDMRIIRSDTRADRVTGTGTCLVILWDFVDHAADQTAHPSGDYQDMIFSVGVFPTGSMNDYYREVSYGAFEIGGGVVGWTTANETYASYANTDGSQDPNTCKAMIADAIAQLDPLIDFAQYDNDGPDGVPDSGDDDGLVDAMFFVHAGPGEESTGAPEDIWSHAWSFSGGLATNDGVLIYRYSVEPEEQPDGSLMTMGVFAHEYGHVLGLPDLYDTDYSSSGIGEWGLMAGGSWCARAGDDAGSSPSHMTAWSKNQLGWLDPIIVTTPLTGEIIPPVETNAVAYRIFRGGTAVGDEYFLVEHRRPLGFDEGLLRRQLYYGFDQPEGLVIYHVDDSVGGNSNDLHRLVDVVDASPWFHPDGTWHENLDGVRDYARWIYLDEFNRGDNGDIWPGFTAFTADSTDWVAPRDRDTFSDLSIPPATDYECNPTGVTITDIGVDGDAAFATFLFTTGSGSTGAVVTADVTWDFEVDTGNWQFCNSYVHRDETQDAGCSGNAGLWFGTNDWACPGYGNNWSDFTLATVLVGADQYPTVLLRHKYDLEAGYDYAYLEVRPAGDIDAEWTILDAYNGAAGCQTESYPIPAGVLAAAAGTSGAAMLDLRLRLTSDGGWSAEDGIFCGFGWWIDEVTVTGTYVVGVDDLPGLGRAMELAAPSPNPFNPATVLKYHMPVAARRASLVVYDQRGRVVRRLPVPVTATGWQEVRWDGRDETGGRTASGLYFARFEVDGAVQIRKMALVK